MSFSYLKPSKDREAVEALQPQDLGVRKPDLVDELELNRDPVDAGHVRLDEGSLKTSFKPV